MKWIIFKNNLSSSCNVGLDLTKKISDHAIFQNSCIHVIVINL